MRGCLRHMAVWAREISLFDVSYGIYGMMTVGFVAAPSDGQPADRSGRSSSALTQAGSPPLRALVIMRLLNYHDSSELGRAG
jgi:hypothetical protein